MTRAVLAGLLGLTLTLGAAADDKKTGDKGAGDKTKHEATITKVDAKNHTVTVKMKGKDGKETEKTFKQIESATYLDSTGKVATLDVFKNGDDVLIVEADGQLKEMHKAKKGTTTGGTTNKK